MDKWVVGTFGDGGIVKAIGSKTIKSTFGRVIMLRKEIVIFTKHWLVTWITRLVTACLSFALLLIMVDFGSIVCRSMRRL